MFEPFDADLTHQVFLAQRLQGAIQFGFCPPENMKDLFNHLAVRSDNVIQVSGDQSAPGLAALDVSGFFRQVGIVALDDLIGKGVIPGARLGHADGQHLEPHLQFHQRAVKTGFGALGTHVRLAPQTQLVHRPFFEQRLVNLLGFGRHGSRAILFQVVVQIPIVLADVKP